MAISIAIRYESAQEPASFRGVVEDHHTFLKAYIARHLKTSVDAEDLA